MDQWSEVATVQVGAVFNFSQVDLTCIQIDPFNDLVWTGLTSGVVLSFRGRHLEPFISFQAHNGPVHDLQVTEKFLWSLGEDGVHCTKRTGLAVSHIPEANGNLLLIREHELYVANSRRVNRYNISTCRETGSFALDAAENVAIMYLKSTLFNFCLGLSDGTIQIIDCDTFDTLQNERCHPGPLTSLDCRRNLVISCGLCTRKHGTMNDQIIHLYDSRLRKRIPMPPLSSGAKLAVLHPKSATCLFGLSPSGQLYLIDAKIPNQMSIQQVILMSEPRFMDVSLRGDILVIAEKGGYIHLWSPNDVTDSKPLPKELALPERVLYPMVGDDDPLSVIGMPHYKTELLSSWNEPAKFEVGLPPEKHFQGVQRNVIRSHKSGSLGTRRSSVSVPMFLSERERLGIEASNYEKLFEEELPEIHKVPRAYRQMEIRYSKFGVDDFDFKFYNSSPYAGLENQSPSDTYCNAVLQLLRWCAPIHNWALTTFAGNVNESVPVLGHVAMLFDMLNKASGRHCRAANFLTMLSDDTELNASSLWIHASSSSGKISVLLFYLLDKLLNEEKELNQDHSSSGTSGAQSLFTTINICHTQRVYGTCGFRDFSSVMSPHLEARSVSLRGLTASLRSSLDGTLWCEGCKKSHSVTIVKQADRLPDVLFVTIPSTTETGSEGSYKNHGSNGNGVGGSSSSSSSSINGSLSDTIADGFSVEKRADKSLKFIKDDEPEFSLQGFIAEISDRETRHTVAIVKIEGEWYLFNDFLVTPLTQNQALDLSAPWKQPILLVYIRNTAQQAFDYESWKKLIDPSSLLKQQYSYYNPSAVEKAEPLSLEELRPGLLVALDAEFVLLKREISEIHSNGTKSVVKPGTLSLARVSVVRAEGPKMMVPLIDDVIEMQHPVYDYLTVYSGIKPGDLNPGSSPHSLVSHQTAIRKLWILLNLGCVFVGHALANDFRTINLQVPSEHLIDTIDLFQRNGPRKLSLKFLIWAVLGDRVQTGNHDSIEDAISALRLYREYLRLKEVGELDQTFDRIYELGQATGYKVPS